MGWFIEWWIATFTHNSIDVLGIDVPAWVVLVLGLGGIVYVAHGILRPR